MTTWGRTMPWWQGPILLVTDTRSSDLLLQHRYERQSYSRKSTTAVTPFVRKLMCLCNSCFSQVAEQGVYDIWQQSCMAVGQQTGSALTLQKSTCFWPTGNSDCNTSTVHCKFQHVTVLSLQVLPMLVRILLYLLCHKLCPIGNGKCGGRMQTGKINPGTGHEGTEGEYRYSFTFL